MSSDPHDQLEEGSPEFQDIVKKLFGESMDRLGTRKLDIDEMLETLKEIRTNAKAHEPMDEVLVAQLMIMELVEWSEDDRNLVLITDKGRLFIKLKEERDANPYT